MEEYSVAIATYNGEKYIVEQLESIINQTVRPAEIIISDDGSTDGTLNVAETFLNKHKVPFKILKHEENHGVIGNFSNAILNCKFSVVFTSDQDDVWLSNKAEELLNVFKLFPNALLVFSDGYLVDSKLRYLKSTLWKAVGLDTKKFEEKDWFKYLLKGCIVTGATMAIKKDFFCQSLPIPQEWLHDGWLAWLAVGRNGLVACPKKLINYRQHESNVVGMSPKGSYGRKIKRWIDNIKILSIFRKNRLLRYQSVLLNSTHYFSERQLCQIKECVEFWNELNNIEDKKIMYQWNTIFILFFKGQYKKYYCGFTGFIRDIMWTLVK